MNVLFICSRNKWRSRTAETIYRDNREHTVRSAGTEEGARIRVTEKLVDWADLIFVMEKRHRERLVSKFPAAMDGKRVMVLNIPDEYEYMDEELVEILRSSVSEHF